jgi:hypothetical protein
VNIKSLVNLRNMCGAYLPRFSIIFGYPQAIDFLTYSLLRPFLLPQTSHSSTHLTMAAEHNGEEVQLAKVNALWLLHADDPKFKARYSDAANSDEQPTRQLEIKSYRGADRKLHLELNNGRWCSKVKDVLLPVITIQTICQQVHHDWMDFRASSTNINNFADDFRNRWVGARHEDVRFIINAIEDAILSAKRTESEHLDDVESRKLSKSAPRGHLLRDYSKKPNNPAAD